MNDFWQHCSNLLRQELTPQQYQTWIKPLAALAFDTEARVLCITAPNRFKLDWVKTQFSGRIADLARGFWQQPVEVQFMLAPKSRNCAPMGTGTACIRRLPARRPPGRILNMARRSARN